MSPSKFTHSFSFRQNNPTQGLFLHKKRRNISLPYDSKSLHWQCSIPILPSSKLSRTVPVSSVISYKSGRREGKGEGQGQGRWLEGWSRCSGDLVSAMPASSRRAAASGCRRGPGSRSDPFFHGRDRAAQPGSALAGPLTLEFHAASQPVRYTLVPPSWNPVIYPHCQNSSNHLVLHEKCSDYVTIKVFPINHVLHVLGASFSIQRCTKRCINVS